MSDTDTDSSFSGFGPDDIENAAKNNQLFDSTPNLHHDSDTDSSFSGFDTDDVEQANNNLYNYSDIEVSSVSSVDSGGESDEDVNDEYDPGFEPLFKMNPPKWTRNFRNVHVPPFMEPTGPKLPAKINIGTATELDYFKLFFDDNMVQMITRNTNIYANYVIEQKRARNANYTDKNWDRDTTPEDISAYYGLCMIFGSSPSPRYKNFWSKDPFLGNDGVKATMTKTLYEKISEYLHVSDRCLEVPRNHPNYDHLQKVRPLLDHMAQSFLKYMRCSPEQAIDESMVAFHGHWFTRQFIKNKPHRYGIKIWACCNSLASSSTSSHGYLQQCDIYLGRRGGSRISRNGQIFDVVNKLTMPIRGKNHRLYMDNLYTSFDVLKFLHGHNIFVAGTIRSNCRNFPEELKEPQLERGEHITLQDRNFRSLTVTCWEDTKSVKFASCLSQPDLMTQTIRCINGQYQNVSQPHVASQYAMYYKAVDYFDYCKERYPAGRSSKKVWKFLMWFWYNSCMVNAHILFKTVKGVSLPKNYDQFKFWLNVAKGLIGTYSNHQRALPCPHASINVQHKNVHMKSKRPKCCYAHKRFKPNGKSKYETVYGCLACGIHLCKDCHQLFHNDINL